MNLVSNNDLRGEMQGSFLPEKQVRAAPQGRFVERSRSGVKKWLRFPGQWLLQEESRRRLPGSALSHMKSSVVITKQLLPQMGADACNWRRRAPRDC